MLGNVLGHNKYGVPVIGLNTQLGFNNFSREPYGFTVEGGKTYTISGKPKGIIFYDENGKEIGTHQFKKSKKTTQTFNVPDGCHSIGFKN